MVRGIKYCPTLTRFFLTVNYPIKYMPILLLQLIYKLAWLFIVFIPNFIGDGVQFYTIMLLIIFLMYIVGDILTLPFRDLFKRKLE